MDETAKRPSGKSERAVWWICLFVGLVGGTVCAGIVYPVSADARVGGFPIPAYAWERLESGAWGDFVGALTGPALLVDFAIGFWVFRKASRWIASRLKRSRRG
jgi:hypothetical protein